MEPVSQVSILQVAAKQEVHTEPAKEWWGRTITTWPTWLSVPTFAVLQGLHLDILSSGAKCDEVHKKMPKVIKQIIFEYSFPADIEDAVREEMKRWAERWKNHSPPTRIFGCIIPHMPRLSPELEQLLKECAPFTKQVTLLDFHDISLRELRRGELAMFAQNLPNLKHLNFAKCDISGSFLHNMGYSIEKGFLNNVETIDFRNNKRQFFAKSDRWYSDEMSISDLATLPKLKKLIVSGNAFPYAEKAKAAALYPNLEIIHKD